MATNAARSRCDPDCALSDRLRAREASWKRALSRDQNVAREIGGDCLQLPSAKRELPPTESAHVNDPTEKRSKMETPGDCLQPPSRSERHVNLEGVDAVRAW